MYFHIGGTHIEERKRKCVESADILGLTSIQALLSDQIKFCIIVLYSQKAFYWVQMVIACCYSAKKLKKAGETFG